MVVCLSRSYLASRNCLQELKLARELHLRKRTRMVLIAMEPEVRFEAMRGWQHGSAVEFEGAEGARRVHRHTVAWAKSHLMDLMINEEWSAGAAGSEGWSEQHEDALESIIRAADKGAGPGSAGGGGDFEVGVAGDGGHYLRDKALAEPPGMVAAAAAEKRGADEESAAEAHNLRRGAKRARMVGDEAVERGGGSGRKRGRGVEPQLVVAFFPETKRDDVNLLGEAQRLQTDLSQDAWNFKVYPRPTVDVFQSEMFKLPSDAGAFVHFAGHCKKDGTLQWLQDLCGKKEELLDSSVVVRIVKQAARAVECAVFNGCWSSVLGKMLREKAGVRNVLCWQGKVGDKRASAVVMCFYESLKHRAPGGYDYKSAVEKAKIELLKEKQREVKKGFAVPRERLCFYSEETGDILPGNSEDDQEWGDSDDEESESLGESGAESDDDATVANPDTAASGSGMSGGALGEPVRSATNKQGNGERDGCKKLGFCWFVNGLSMEAGIRLYLDEGLQPNGALASGKSLHHYGLKESKRELRPGKKHLIYERWALRKVFKSTSITCYEDVFAAQGPLETRVETLEEQSQDGNEESRQELLNARTFFQSALAVRQAQLNAANQRGTADANHQQMVTELTRLVRRIKEAAALPRAVPAGGAGAGLEGSVGGMSIDDGSKGGAWQEAKRRR